ncbi:DNA polymerase III alpha subunit [Paraburkholderia youngii]
MIWPTAHSSIGMTSRFSAGPLHLPRSQAIVVKRSAGCSRRAGQGSAARDEEVPGLRAPTEGQDIVADYRSLGFTLGRHALALLGPQLAAMRATTAEHLRGYRNGQLARACGIVTARQRPITANGVMFMTLEDDTGHVNVIVWPSVLGKQRREALGASLLVVYGVWQREGEVRHL